MEKLFYQDTHIIDFEAIVTDCRKDSASDGYYIILDRTAFFPEEGGQTADKGTINGRDVLDVQIRQNIIYHLMADPLPVGSTIMGHVDWNRRFDFMQQHSGEHILSGLIHKHYGFQNVGFHLSDREVTMDLDGQISFELLREIEAEANRIIWANIPVNAYFPSKETLASLTYRSKIEIEGDIRIVEIPGVDVCACCAPHVSSTGEIGIIKINSVQSHRGGVRLSILCGQRALRDYTTKQETVGALSNLLSTGQERLTDAVNKLRADSVQMKEAANQLSNQLLQLQISSLPAPSEAANVVLFSELSNMVAIRNTINELTKRYSGYCAFFSGNGETGYSFILGSSKLDCTVVSSFLKERFGAKCGGSKLMVQGSVTACQKQLDAFFQAL